MLRRLRIAKGFNQSTVARSIGISQADYSHLEIGQKVSLHHYQVAILATTLGGSVEKIMALLPVTAPREPRTKLGALIRSRREALHLDYSALGRRLGLTAAEVKNREYNRHEKLTYRTAQKLAAALELPLTIFSPFLSGEKKPTPSAFGQVIRARRRAKLLPTAELARRLGVTTQQVNHIERGRCYYLRDHGKMRKLAEVLDLDPDQLLNLRPLPPARYLRREPGSLGEFLTKRRLELGLTQSMVARRSRTHISIVNQIERNSLIPSRQLLHTLTAVLSCQLPPEFSIP